MSLLILLHLKSLHSWWLIINIMNGTWINSARSLTSPEYSLSFIHSEETQNLVSFGNDTSITSWWVLLLTSNTLPMIVPFTKLHSKVIKSYHYKWLMIFLSSVNMKRLSKRSSTYVTYRPDIGYYAITTMRELSTKPFKYHYELLKRIAKHLCETKDWGIK